MVSCFCASYNCMEKDCIINFSFVWEPNEGPTGSKNMEKHKDSCKLYYITLNLIKKKQKSIYLCMCEESN